MIEIIKQPEPIHTLENPVIFQFKDKKNSATTVQLEISSAIITLYIEFDDKGIATLDITESLQSLLSNEMQTLSYNLWHNKREEKRNQQTLDYEEDIEEPLMLGTFTILNSTEQPITPRTFTQVTSIGTQGNNEFIPIYTVDDFLNINSLPNPNNLPHVLMNDLDLGSAAITPIDGFNGKLYGQGFIVSNINSQLFSELTGEVNDIIFDNINSSLAVGNYSNRGSFVNCKFINIFVSYYSFPYLITSCNLKFCYLKCDDSAYWDFNSEGLLTNCRIENCRIENDIENNYNQFTSLYPATSSNIENSIFSLKTNIECHHNEGLYFGGTINGSIRFGKFLSEIKYDIHLQDIEINSNDRVELRFEFQNYPNNYEIQNITYEGFCFLFTNNNQYEFNNQGSYYEIEVPEQDNYVDSYINGAIQIREWNNEWKELKEINAIRIILRIGENEYYAENYIFKTNPLISGISDDFSEVNNCVLIDSKIPNSIFATRIFSSWYNNRGGTNFAEEIPNYDSWEANAHNYDGETISKQQAQSQQFYEGLGYDFDGSTQEDGQPVWAMGDDGYPTIVRPFRKFEIKKSTCTVEYSDFICQEKLIVNNKNIRQQTNTFIIQPVNNFYEAIFHKFQNGTRKVNFFTWKYLNAVAWTNGGAPYEGRSILKFDLSSIPVDKIIKKAILKLYSTTTGKSEVNLGPNYGTNNAFYIQQINTFWERDTVDCFALSTSNQIRIPHTSEKALDVEVDVTDMLKDMHGNDRNYGFLLRLEDPNYYTCRDFHSSKSDDADKAPSLTIICEASGSFHHAARGQNNRLYFCGESGIWFLDNDGDIKQTNKTDSYFYFAVMGQDNKLYFGSDQGIWYLDNDDVIRQTLFTDNTIYCAALAGNNKLYFGSSDNSGIWVLDSDRQIRQTNVTEGSFTCITKGNNGKLYFCSVDNGIWMLDDDGDVIQTNKADGNFNYTVLYNGKLYFGGAFEDSLWYLDTNSEIKNAGLSGMASWNAACGQDGKLYFCTNGNGINYLDNGALKLTNVTEGVFSYASLGADNKLYFCSSDSGIYFLDDDGDIKQTNKFDGAFNCLSVGQDGNTYLCSADNTGIWFFDREMIFSGNAAAKTVTITKTISILREFIYDGVVYPLLNEDDYKSMTEEQIQQRKEALLASICMCDEFEEVNEIIDKDSDVCEKPLPPSSLFITIDGQAETQLIFDGCQMQSQQITIEASGNWTVEMPSWLALSQTAGQAGITVITIETKSRTNCQYSDTLVFKLVGSEKEATCNVIQSECIDGSELRLTFRLSEGITSADIDISGYGSISITAPDHEIRIPVQELHQIFVVKCLNYTSGNEGLKYGGILKFSGMTGGIDISDECGTSSEIRVYASGESYAHITILDSSHQC